MNSYRQLWERFWQVTKPYWVSSEKKGALALLLLVVILSVSSSSFLVVETIQRSELVSALAGQDTPRFQRALFAIGSIIVATVPLLSFKNLCAR